MRPRFNHGQPRPAVFLDRDGTINKQVGYINDISQLELLPGAAEAISRINRLGYFAIVVTNQSAIARGLATMEQVRRVNAEVSLRVARESGARIDAFYACPFHPEFHDSRWSEYRDWRKPMPGMFHAAAREFPVEVSRSWLIGDGAIDHEAAKAFNPLVRTVLLPSVYHDNDCGADFYTPTLLDATTIVAQHAIMEHARATMQAPAVRE